MKKILSFCLSIYLSIGIAQVSAAAACYDQQAAANLDGNIHGTTH